MALSNLEEAQRQSRIRRIRELEAALEWIVKIADANYEQDEALRSNGARTLKRISDRAQAVLNGESDVQA